MISHVNIESQELQIHNDGTIRACLCDAELDECKSQHIVLQFNYWFTKKGNIGPVYVYDNAIQDSILLTL